MSMKGTGWKQLALSIAGALLCRISIMGCYPFVSAFYAAVYLEEQGRWLLSVGMLAGMIAFLPITVIAKYAMALLIIAECLIFTLLVQTIFGKVSKRLD